MRLLVALVILFLCGCAGENTSSESTRSVQGPVLFLGDSLTVHSDAEQRFPQAKVTNAGASGFSTVQILEIARNHAQENPRLVVILAGINDSWKMTQTVDSCRAIDDMVALFPRSVVVIMTVPNILGPTSLVYDPTIIDRINTHIRSMGDRAIIVDFQAAIGDDRQYRTHDGMHLIEPGYQVWHDLLVPYIGTGG